MSDAVINSLLSAAGGLVGALLLYLGTRMTSRAAVKAQESAREIDQQKVDAEAYTKAQKIWDDVIKVLQSQVDKQDARLEKQDDLINGFRSRLEDLEQKRAGDRRAIHELTEYIRDLLALIKDHNLTPPPPPEGLDLER